MAFSFQMPSLCNGSRSLRKVPYLCKMGPLRCQRRYCSVHLKDMMRRYCWTLVQRPEAKPDICLSFPTHTFLRWILIPIGANALPTIWLESM